VPTLMLWGEEDAFAAPQSGRELAARMRACRVEVLSSVGHLPQLGAPERVADLVNGFCREAAEPGRLTTSRREQPSP
jgi:pimeloyl-ACP methyl ester carboxylesterase